ncbi:MAG: hypothetical protein ACRC14_16790, partial [Paracoccaceae bacterium]
MTLCLLIRPIACAAMVALLSVAGCRMPTLSTAERPVAMLGGSLQVAGPRGYCVDHSAGRQGQDTAVVLMGRCRGALAVQPALLTISIGPTASAGAMAAGGQALSAYFTSAEGRAALSRDGRTGDVQVIEAIGVGNSLLLHVS